MPSHSPPDLASVPADARRPADRARRSFLALGAGSAGLLVSSVAAGAASPLPPTPVDTGAVQGGRVVFPPWRDEADAPGEPPPAPLPPEQRVGLAIVGLGRLTLEQLLPALAQSRQARAVALVSGSPEKMATVAKQYGIAPDACLSYAEFDRLSGMSAVQGVYIVLPNSMHREYTMRAARAGKHVLCEKPMATSVDDARAMVAACRQAGVRLMIAYRIQYQPHHLRARQLVRDRTFGRLVAFSAGNAQTAHPTATQQWRHKRTMAGGGALPDIGLYALNTARFVSGEEPVQVFAHLFSPPGDARFAEVEQTVDFMLRFPSGLVAHCMATYGAREDKWQKLQLERAALDMPNAYDYEGQRLFVGMRQGDDKVQQEWVLPRKNQFAEEIDHFADCVRTGREPRTPGEEGLRDQILMDAIYRSAREAQPVSVRTT